MKHVMVALGCFVWIVLAAGCQYDGPGTPTDYTMAASASWVVGGSNYGFCRQGFTRPSNAGGGLEACRPTGDFAGVCGGYLSAGDPQVVYNYRDNRWYYSVLILGVGACVTSAPDADPLALDRAALVTFPTDVDRPQLAVSDNKIAVSIYRMDHFTSITRVLNKGDFLAGAPARSATINHNQPVMLAAQAASAVAGSIVWSRPGGGRDRVFGLITGVPGEGGGIITTSASVPGDGFPGCQDFIPVPGGGADRRSECFPVAGQGATVYRTNPAGSGAVWMALAIDGNQIVLERFANIAPTFAPYLAEAHRMVRPLPGGPMCMSLSVDVVTDRALLGFLASSDSVYPSAYLVIKPADGSIIGPALWKSGIPSPYTPSVNGFRRDYCPQGAWAFINGYGNYIGVGWQFYNGGAYPSDNYDNAGMTAMFCRDQGGTNPCTS